MDAEADRPLVVAARRRARRLAYWNGAVWAIGNGLASDTLVIYLAQELGAARIGLGIGLILATRHVLGLLRLGAPMLIGRLVDRKRFCLAAYLASALVLLGLPWVATPGRLPSPGASLAALVGLWCVYHLLQYVGTIALWSWLADLVPLQIRGRFLGRRERWMVAGEAAALLSSAAFVWGWQYLHPDQPHWVAYLVPAVMGAGFMIAALVPLVLIPRAARSWAVRFGATFRSLLAPLGDRRFLPLILFGCWLALANGITQSAQYTDPKEVLNVRLFILLALQTAMFCGQWALGPWLGRLADRLGNRPVMIGSLLLVAQAPLVVCRRMGSLDRLRGAERLPAQPDAEALARRVQHALHRHVLRRHRAVLRGQHDRRRGHVRPVWRPHADAAGRAHAGLLPVRLPAGMGCPGAGRAGPAAGDRAPGPFVVTAFMRSGRPVATGSASSMGRQPPASR
jgi:hypothetical protein